MVKEVASRTSDFAGDGTIFHVEGSISSIPDNEGHDVGRMASFVDITVSKQMEKALEESSDKYNSLPIQYRMVLNVHP